MATLAVGVSAQQQLPVDPDISNVKLQVRTFETALKVAVEHGAQAVADRAGQVYPGAVIGWSSDPVVKGWRQSFGYIFEVEVQTIIPVTLQVYRMGMQQAPGSRAVPVTPVSAGSAVKPPAKTVTGASGLPEAAPAAPLPGAANFDPEQEYSDRVRDALINALLENSRSLPLKDTDILSINAAPAELPIPNPLEPKKRRLILEISGAQLALYHRDPTKKDAVRQLIVESRF